MAAMVKAKHSINLSYSDIYEELQCHAQLS